MCIYGSKTNRERERVSERISKESFSTRKRKRKREKVLFLAPVFPLFCKLTDCQCLRHLACTCPALPEQLHGLIMSPKSVPKQNRHCMGSLLLLLLLLLLFTFEDDNDLENSGEEYDASSSRRGGNEEGGEGCGSGSGRMRIGRRPRLLHSSMNAPHERNTAKRTCPGLMKSMWKFCATREEFVTTFSPTRFDFRAFAVSSSTRRTKARMKVTVRLPRLHKFRDCC